MHLDQSSSLHERANECVRRCAVHAVDTAKITPNTRLIEDLGYDSIRAIMLLVDLETTFTLTIADEGVNLEHAFTTVGDIYRFLDATVLQPRA